MIQNHLLHDHGQTIEQELEHMPSAENFQTVADIFKQLGDGSRIRIWGLLYHCEECVINLSAMVDMSSPAFSPPSQAVEISRSDCQPPRRKRGLLSSCRYRTGPTFPPHD